MIAAVLDTTVILHLFRQHTPALTWFNNQQTYGVTLITWLEVMAGAINKVNQSQCKTLLDQFDLLYPTADDQQWAMQQLERFQFTHHIGKEDYLIAAVAYRLQLPLYTHNLKDMTKFKGFSPPQATGLQPSW